MDKDEVSDELEMLEKKRMMNESKIAESIASASGSALEEARERGILKRFDNEHATMYFGPVGLVLGRSSPATWKLIKEYYLQVFQHLYPAQVPDHYAKDNPPLNPVDLWLDLEHSALYHRLKLEDDSPVFATAQELEQWITQKAQQPRSKAA